MNAMPGIQEHLDLRAEGRRTVVPAHLPLERAWRWCLVATLRDLRVSVDRGRLISLPSLRRLFLRRWATVCWANEIREDAAVMARRDAGVDQVLERYGAQMADCGVGRRSR